MRIIRGKYGRRRFDVPSNIKARPTTDFAKENLFNVLENEIDFEQTQAIDLFAGTGAISLELISRGCPRVVCVEAYHVQYNFIKKLIDELKEENLHAIKGDVFKYIERSRDSFDFVFADPPYDLKELSSLPEIILESTLLKEGGLLIVEHGRTNTFGHLKQFRELRTYGSVNFSFFEK